ncbi:MAG: hypothetical protein IH949_08590 [Bacteroidetes bacterium]|nr:hypothetical protein [Bacteroidota bacterium]
MVTKSIIIVIVASLLSGIIGIIISNIYHARFEERKIKIDTFKRVFSNRYDLQGDEFSKALNEIFVIYNNSENVISALRSFHQKVVNKQNSEDELLKLLKTMCKEVDINFDDFNDSFFLKPFNTRQSSMSHTQ